jgi:hypothetical protein
MFIDIALLPVKVQFSTTFVSTLLKKPNVHIRKGVYGRECHHGTKRNVAWSRGRSVGMRIEERKEI